MTGRLGGLVAVVTGAAQGIGQALAVRLAAEGAAVAVVDLNGGADTVTAITEAVGTAQSFIADLSDRASAVKPQQQVARAVGTTDILVNNAAIYPWIPFADLTLKAWQHTFRVTSSRCS